MQTNTSQAREHDIVVDLDADDPDKAVSRIPVRQQRSEKQTQELTQEEERRLDRKAFAKRFGKIERNFEQRIADQEARHQREIAEMKGRGERLNVKREGVNDDAVHEADIARLTSLLEAAQEAGESKKVAQLTAEISRKEGQHWAKKEAAVRGEPAVVEPRKVVASAAKNKAIPDKGNTQTANRWLRQNEDWLQDDDYAVEQQAALLYDAALTDEGYDPSTDEYFEELNARLLKKFPKLEVIGAKAKKKAKATEDDEGRRSNAGRDDDDDGDDERPEPRRIPAVSSFEDRGTPARGQRNGRRTSLTAEQRQTMLAVNMDPENNRHVLTFLREAGQVE